MPLNAASDEPRAQLVADERLGRPPFNRTSARFDTTARMATPVRVLNSNKRRPNATTYRQPDDDQLVIENGHTEDLDLALRPEEGFDDPVDVGAPDDLGQRDQPEQHAHRHDRLDDLRGAFEPAHDHDIEEQTECGRQHKQDERHARQNGNVPFHAQLPVGEGRHHRGRTVREVEDARRRIGHHQAAGEHGIDGRGDQSDDGEL